MYDCSNGICSSETPARIDRVAELSPLLQCRNLTRAVSTAEGPKKIVDSFSYQFSTGQVYSIVGPSGAGKSSLLRLFNRLDDFSSGELLYRSEEIRSLDPCRLRRKLGMLFQTPCLFPGTVRDNLLAADEGLSDGQARHFLGEAETDPAMIDFRVDNLSAGEKQRVALARLMATRPEVILLDEPTSALDPTHTVAIERMILRTVGDNGLTAIVVTHDPAQALRLGGETLLMVAGRLVESGTAEDVINSPQTELGKQYRRKELK